LWFVGFQNHFRNILCQSFDRFSLCFGKSADSICQFFIVNAPSDIIRFSHGREITEEFDGHQNSLLCFTFLLWDADVCPEFEVGDAEGIHNTILASCLALPEQWYLFLDVAEDHPKFSNGSFLLHLHVIGDLEDHRHLG